MERLILVFVLAIILAISIGLIAQQDRDLDGPAGAIGKVESLGWPNSYHFSSGTSVLLADGPAPPILNGYPISFS